LWIEAVSKPVKTVDERRNDSSFDFAPRGCI
jgi:hypothetical protein